MSEKHDGTTDDNGELCACVLIGRLPCDGGCRNRWRTRSDGSRCGACYTEDDLTTRRPRSRVARG